MQNKIWCLLLPCLILVLRTDTYTPHHSSSSSSSSRNINNNVPFIRKQDMIGIWRLTHQEMSLPNSSLVENQTGNDDDDDDDKRVQKKNESPENIVEEEIVLRLNEDGSFDPYTSLEESTTTRIKRQNTINTDLFNLHNILSRGGSWEFRGEKLILAPDRPTNADVSKVHDTLLAGKLKVQVSECLPTTDRQPIEDETIGENVKRKDQAEGTGSSSNTDTEQPEIDMHLSIPSGKVKTGKFMYPRRHKAFFEEPMLFPESSIGSFTMKQLLGNLNARLKREQDESNINKPKPKYDKTIFYDRRFYLTATPHGVNPKYAAQDKHFNEENVKYDVRVMPITFHSNNTFTAIGTEKTLRGRFGITGNKGDKLWFQVNLFGFGRSAPGSVYSEGRLLSHDDKRGYLGTIQEYHGGTNNQTLYFVDGAFYYGTDLKRTNKAHSWGTFSLQEITQEEQIGGNAQESGIDEDDDADYDIEREGNDSNSPDDAFQ